MHHRPARAARVAACSALAAATVAALPASALAAPSQIIDTTAKTAPPAAFDRLAETADAAKTGRTPVLVTLKARLDVADAASTSTASALDRRMRSLHRRALDALAGTDYSHAQGIEGLPYLALDASPEALDALEASDAVSAIQSDRTLEPALATSTQVIESVPQTTRAWDGTGKVVAVIDSGVDDQHPFLLGRLVEPACFARAATCPNGQTTQFGPGAAKPYHEHGTHVAGIVAGRRFPGVNYDGVAPNARIMPIRIPDTKGALLSPPGGVQQSDVMQALSYVRQRALAGTAVAAVNVSMADTPPANCDADPLKTQIDSLKTMGIPVIFASGNNYRTNGIGFPACISSAIAVGSTRTDDVVSLFSNAGEDLDLLAPGQGAGDYTGIISSNPQSDEPFLMGPIPGTSMAAPHVAGAWAVYVQRHPGASVDEVLAAFKSTGKPVRDRRIEDTDFIRPRINLSAALARSGYVVADRPTSSAYNPSRQSNSMSATNSVSRTGTGTYTVTLPKLGPSGYANVHVQAYGSTTNRCQISGLNWSQPRVSLRCTTAAGVAADTTFLVRFEVNETRRPHGAAYLTSFEPSLDEHVPEPRYQSNAAGATNIVTRSGVGEYSLEFPGSTTTGVPHVSSLGSGASCQLTALGSTAGAVACYTPQGTRADTALSFTVNSASTFTGGRGASLYASNPTSTTAYTPTTRWNSTGATNTVRKVSTGTYQVTMPGIPAATSIPTVTAAGTATAVTCRPVSWTDGAITVGCANSSGAAVDSRFSVSYASKDA